MKKLYFLLSFLLLSAGVFAKDIRWTVAQDGSGDYTTVQAALDAVPVNNTSRITIFIKKGTYTEKLHLDSTKNKVTLIGEDQFLTVLTYNDHSGKRTPNGDTINTFTSQSFLIEADDFRAENITFQNNAGYSAGQAVALSVKGDRAVFKNCRIIGFQDTLYTGGTNSRQYYKNCYIEGTTDFIFGPSTAVFQSCQIHSKRNSHVTAASTPLEKKFGYVFIQCRLTADSGITKATLGRPWRPYAAVTYLYCHIGAHIIAAGWDNWRNPANEKTARYAEYRNEGAGADKSKRVPWARQLSRKEARQYKLKHIFSGWNPERSG